MDREIKEVQKAVFFHGSVRSWQNGKTQVFLPGVDEDMFFVFTHFLKHFYKEGGVSLRQLCDWCRLLWTYRSSIDVRLLGKRLRSAGLISEWRAFAVVAVEYLGMPLDSILFYSEDKQLGEESFTYCRFYIERGRVAKMERYYCCREDISVEHF